MDIAEVREQTGLTNATLHHYEQIGLISSTGRIGLRRQYDDDVIGQLAVIVLCQRCGFSLKEIGDLMSSKGQRKLWRRAVESKVLELDQQLADLTFARQGLQHALNCTHPNILMCEHFRARTETVFDTGGLTDR
jgi:DNA-binding transcriptional MerR regulator